MIVALLNQHSSVGKPTLAPHFTNRSSRQGKRIALIDADPQGPELDWSEQGALQRRDRLVGVRLVRDMPDREAAALARGSDHSIIEEVLHVAALRARRSSGAASPCPTRGAIRPRAIFPTPMENAREGQSQRHERGTG